MAYNLIYDNDGNKWSWWRKEWKGNEDGVSQYYTTNHSGEGVFFVNLEKNSRKQLVGTCDFSLAGLKDPKRKIRRYMNCE